MSRTTYKEMKDKLMKLKSFKGSSVTALNIDDMYIVMSYDTIIFSLNLKTNKKKYCSQKISRTTSKIQHLISLAFDVDEAENIEYERIYIYPMGICY